MIFLQKQPAPGLSRFIKKYWLIDSQADQKIHRQKIVPDGYPEVIFHYRDPYLINISGNWQLQEKTLLAGQIRKHFYLENTGSSGMFGIKFQPTAIRALFGYRMEALTDQVIAFDHLPTFVQWISHVRNPADVFEVVVEKLENHLLSDCLSYDRPIEKGEHALNFLLQARGAIGLGELTQKTQITERTLERYFQEYVGLSPKFYSRVIRFAHIFELVQVKKKNWPEITYHAGFYDQSHFIKNFKEFTGEEPSNYGFTEKNMANFFFEK